ncbi:MAG TPA: PAS domain S-box protein [Methylomirabilota bacterium]|nr:PAS domain S-box protein [Methylomirabilota bacterium]
MGPAIGNHQRRLSGLKSAMQPVDPILATIMDACRVLGDGIIVTAADLDRPGPRIVHVNDALCRITGYRPDELIGNTPRLLQGVKTNRAVLAALRSSLDVHRQFAGEVVNYRKGGREYSVELQIAPVAGPDGRPLYWLSLHRDVTEIRRTEAELREREFRFRSLLGNMRDIIVCHGERGGDPHGYTDGASLLGRDVQRMAGTLMGDKANIDLWYRSIHPDDREAYLGAERRRKERGEAYTLEYRITHPVTGELRWMQETGWSVPLLEGDRSFLDSYIIDITDRKRAESLLAGQNRVLEMIARSVALEDALDALVRFIEGESAGMLGSILLLDEEGLHLRHGAAPSLPPSYVRAIDGVTIGPKVGSCGTAAYRREAVIVADTQEDPLWADYRDLARTHGLRSCWSTPIFSDQGRVLGTFAMYYRTVRRPTAAELKLIDIATHVAGIAIGRRRAEAAQDESEERFRTLADSVPVLIWMSDANGQCIFVNRPWLGYTGRTLMEEFGDRFAESIHADDRARVQGDRRDATETGAMFTGEYRLRRADGAYRWFLDVAGPRRTEDGDYVGHIGVLVDVTERRELEEQLRQMQRLEAIGQLTDGLAHEFNNLLTVVHGNVDMIMAQVGNDGRLAPLLQLIKLAAERGGDLTRRLLAFARRQPLRPEIVDANGLIAGMQEMLRQALDRRVTIDCRCDPALWLTVVDPAQLQAALLGIALNGGDAMPEGGRLTIRTANRLVPDSTAATRDGPGPGPYVVIAVEDTGVGMSADIRRRAIEPFFTTKELGKGSGLGLSMVYGFAKQSRGHVDIESEIGRGTTVTLYLPRAASDAAERAADATLAVT